MKEEKKLMLQENESERGATMVEYALVVALIATVCIVGFSKLGGEVATQMSEATLVAGSATTVVSTASSVAADKLGALNTTIAAMGN